MGMLLYDYIPPLCCSVRRGYFVYKQVCAACHSMEYMCYRHMIGVIATEEEAKSIAEEVSLKFRYIRMYTLKVLQMLVLKLM